MSLRTRELLNLVVLGIVTTIGFVSVYLASQEVPEFSTTSRSQSPHSGSSDRTGSSESRRRR